MERTAMERTAMERTARLSIDSPTDGLHLIRVRGHLDDAAGARLLRLIDARLHINELRVRPGPTHHILVDLTPVAHSSRGGLAALAHAHRAATQRGVGLAVIGAGMLTAQAGTIAARARHALRGIDCYPDIDTAVCALADTPDTDTRDIAAPATRTRPTATRDRTDSAPQPHNDTLVTRHDRSGPHRQPRA